MRSPAVKVQRLLTQPVTTFAVDFSIPWSLSFWVASRCFWKSRKLSQLDVTQWVLLCNYLRPALLNNPAGSRFGVNAALLSETEATKLFFNQTITSSSTPLFRPGLRHFLFHLLLSAVCLKKTAADRWWIRTDETGESFRAADGQRGSWVKGSCLMTKGSSLIMSTSRVKKHFFLMWKSDEEVFLCIVLPKILAMISRS